MRFLSERIEGAAMEKTSTKTIIRAHFSYAGIKSVLLSACLAFSMVACQKAPDQPIPPQAPPTPKATSNESNAGNPYPGLYDANSASSAVFKYKSSEQLQYQNAQGKKLKRLVIRT
jgi:hypothetical protein